MSALAATPLVLRHGVREFHLLRLYAPAVPPRTPAEIVHADFPDGCEIDHLELPGGRGASVAQARQLLHRCITFVAHHMDRSPEDVLGYLLYANECDATGLPAIVRRFGRLRTVRGMSCDAAAFARYLGEAPQQRVPYFRVAGRSLHDWLSEDARIQDSTALAAVAGFETAAELYESCTDGRTGGGVEPREVLLAYYTMRCLSLDAVDLATARNFGTRERGLTFGERRLAAVIFGPDAALRLAALRLGGERDSACMAYDTVPNSAVLTRPRLRGTRGALADLPAAAEFVRCAGMYLHAAPAPLRLKTGTSLRCSMDTTGAPADANAGGAARIEAMVREYVTAVERVRTMRRG